MESGTDTYSIVIPARNEAAGLAQLLPMLAMQLPQGAEVSPK